MNYLDGFSGYGGFHKAFENSGWKFDKCYYSEIDKYAIANYSHNFKNSIYAGSIDTICKSGIIPSIDIFTFGWPCQDNSIAGNRKGQQSGTRSGLLYEAAKIINKFKPRNFLAENVVGLLSVNKGIDIVESFKILAFLNESCPQYDIEMQLLNTRWLLPQNRERLFFIGHLRGSGSRQIFPIGEDNIRLQETEKQFSGQISTKNNIANCLTKSMHKMARTDNYIITHNLQSRLGKGNGGKGHLSKEDQTAYCLDKCNGQAIQILQKDYTKGNSQASRVYSPDGISVTLSSQGAGGGAKTGLYEFDNDIRRLTPIECERLQGLPDNWTKYGMFDGKVKEISDTQRYKLVGNGVSIPIIELMANKLRY